MPEQLWITALLNKHFAGVANAILGIFHLHAAYPRAPIPNYVAMQLVVFVLILLFFAIVPGFESPTAIPSVPLGCALVTWFYYHFQGVRANGFGYVKNFMGPEPWLAILLFPIEIFSHLARILSLTIRLYANMFASDLVTLVFFSLVPLALPVVFILLHIGVSVIQTYIFVLLATVYIGEAVAHEH